MDNFFPKQRWSSEGEPELGVGVVIETSKGRVKVHFPIAGEIRQYAIDNAPLRRVQFKKGDTIHDTNKQTLQVESVEIKDNLLHYYGQERELSEADLGDVAAKHGIDDRLFAGDVDTPNDFALRRNTLDLDHRRRTSPVNGFVGGRIDLIPHQLYIAHEVSRRYAPRVLLSDEVGLGKTIEACLILHRLLSARRISRVLILVPETLVHQWFVELLRRFNGWFNIFDEERCAALDEGSPDGNPFLDDQLVICSTSFLAGSELRSRQALSANWDMLVVDEAHHLEWSTEKVSPEYRIVELLSKLAKGLLLLTATPEQLGLESHFARLRLLDPDRYPNFEKFRNESLDHEEIANVVDTISLNKPLSAKDKKLITTLFGKERLISLDKEDNIGKENLIEDLLDQYGPGRVLFRNTRSAMSGFPKRKVHLSPIEIDEDHDLWIGRLSKEFSNDLKKPSAITTRLKFYFSSDPRVDWLLKKMESLQASKVLLICRNKEKVLSLENTLKKRAPFKVGVFHENLTIVQRDRNAAWFSEPSGAQLLLCSEIGSEGRNFQFAHHLILFDLPFHPELLEQRIGRLDRIGQTKDIQIHIPFVLGSPQEILAKWYNQGLNAFETNLEGGNRFTQLFGKQLLEILNKPSSNNTNKEFEMLIKDTFKFQEKLKTTLAKGRNKLLEINSFKPKIAEKLVKRIKEEDLDKTLESYMTKVFENFGVDMEDLAPRSYLLRSTHRNAEVFPSIPEEGLSVTFDRKRALTREDVSFISWDHPMAIGAIDMVLSLGTGSASFGVLREDGTPGILLEALFVLEAMGDQSLHVDRFLPNTPLRVVVDHSGKDVTNSYPAETLNKKLVSGKIDDLIQNEMLIEKIIPNMISDATEIADLKSKELINTGLNKMKNTLNHEIERLNYLQKKNNHIRTDEIHIAQEEKSNLSLLINNAQIRLDALLLIRKGDF